MDTLNRSAIVVKPKQPFLDWLHAADSTSRELRLLDMVGEPTIYLIPECDTSEEIFEEQLAGWYTDRSTWLKNPHFRPIRLMSIIPCWWIFAMNP